ncbi:MAG: hypothetical protein JWP99_775 [Devosia sp.]|nr:hypothetical protein [Devosia sp.]
MTKKAPVAGPGLFFGAQAGGGFTQLRNGPSSPLLSVPLLSAPGAALERLAELIGRQDAQDNKKAPVQRPGPFIDGGAGR